MARNEVVITVTDKGSSKKFAKNVKGGDKAVNNLTKSAIKLAAAFVTFQAAAKAVDLARIAATAQDTEKAFNNLATSVGIDGDRMLASMQKATAGTIAEFELMQQFSSASLLGLPLDRFDEMLAIARGAAKATGQSMEFMLNSIVTALGRGSKLMLDNLGILIDVKSANERYAESLGKTSSQLNDTERKQAFINDALRIGADNLERIGDLGNSAADDFAKLSADTENLKIALGEALLPVLMEVVPLLITGAEALRALLTPIEDSTDGIGTFALAMADTAVQLHTVREELKQLQDEQAADPFFEEFQFVAPTEEMQILIDDIARLEGQMQTYQNALELAKFKSDLLAAGTEFLALEVTDLNDRLRDENDLIPEMARNFQPLQTAMADSINIAQIFAQSLGAALQPDSNAGEGIKNLALGVISAMEGMVIAAAAANTAISLAWIPGSLAGILATLAGLEAAKAAVRNLGSSGGGGGGGRAAAPSSLPSGSTAAGSDRQPINISIAGENVASVIAPAIERGSELGQNNIAVN